MKNYIAAFISNDNIKKAEQVLIDNGIEPDEAGVVLQATGYALLNEELYPDTGSPETPKDKAASEYTVQLRYGYCNSSKAYGTYCTFEAADVEEKTDSDDIRKSLAEALDCDPEGDDFDWDLTTLAVPQKTVERIQQDAITVLVKKLLAAGVGSETISEVLCKN